MKYLKKFEGYKPIYSWKDKLKEIGWTIDKNMDEYDGIYLIHPDYDTDFMYSTNFPNQCTIIFDYNDGRKELALEIEYINIFVLYDLLPILIDTENLAKNYNEVIRVIEDNVPDFKIPEIESIEDIDNFNDKCEELENEYDYLFNANKIGLL